MEEKNAQLFIDKRAFKGKGAEASRRQALETCQSLVAEARTIKDKLAPLTRQLPYRLILDVRTGRDGESYFVPRWSKGHQSTIWYAIERDQSISPQTIELLAIYNERIEELFALQNVWRAVLGSAVRMSKVQNGEVYNYLTKGPGSGKHRLLGADISSKQA